MDSLKNNRDNKHRDLWYKLNNGKISPEEYHSEIEKINKSAVKKSLRNNLYKPKQP